MKEWVRVGFVSRGSLGFVSGGPLSIVGRSGLDAYGRRLGRMLRCSTCHRRCITRRCARAAVDLFGTWGRKDV